MNSQEIADKLQAFISEGLNARAVKKGGTGKQVLADILSYEEMVAIAEAATTYFCTIHGINDEAVFLKYSGKTARDFSLAIEVDL